MSSVVHTTEFPILPGDVIVKFPAEEGEGEGEGEVVIPGNIAGIFEYIKEVAEGSDEGDFPLVIDSYGSFTSVGLLRCLDFARVFVTKGGCVLPPCISPPTITDDSPEDYTLVKYGFPEWAVRFFEEVPIGDIFEMFRVVEFLRFPVLMRFLGFVIGSYINRLPEDVRQDTFRKSRKLTPKELAAYRESNKWALNMTDMEYRENPDVPKFEYDPSLPVPVREPGAGCDRVLFDGMSMLSEESRKLIVKCI